MQNKLLVCDMDGTLLNTDQTISSDNLQAINRFVESGGLFTVATGRNEPSVRKYLSILPINAPAILHNGALIYDFAKNQIVYESILPIGIRETIERIAYKFPQIGAEIFLDDSIIFPFDNEYTEKHRKREGFEPIYKSLDQIPDGWRKIVLAIDPAHIGHLIEFVASEDRIFDQVQSEDQFLELLPLGANKGTMLRKVAELVGVEMENTITIGDNLNDLEMLSCSGISFAVGNAHPHIKQTAHYTCKENNEHAIADMLENYL